MKSPRSLRGWIQPLAGRGVYLGGDWTAIKERELHWRLYYRGEPFIEGPFRSLTAIQDRVSTLEQNFRLDAKRALDLALGR